MLSMSGEIKDRNGGTSVSESTPNRSVYMIRKRNRPDDMPDGFEVLLCALPEEWIHLAAR